MPQPSMPPGWEAWNPGGGWMAGYKPVTINEHIVCTA